MSSGHCGEPVRLGITGISQGTSLSASTAQHGTVCCTQAPGTSSWSGPRLSLHLHENIPCFPYIWSLQIPSCMGQGSARSAMARAADGQEVWEVPEPVRAGVCPNELVGGDGWKEPSRADPSPAACSAITSCSSLDRRDSRESAAGPASASESIGVL